MLATIGYEQSKPEDFIATLKKNEIEVLVDVRDRAQSRKRGFSKTALSNAVTAAGIEYIHLRSLGDPKAGRDAARSGRIELFKQIYFSVLSETPAQEALAKLESLARLHRICLMCYERDHRHCHRKIVSDALERTLGCKAVHLGVMGNEPRGRDARRVLHTRQGAAA